jgi:hypothetical protein
MTAAMTVVSEIEFMGLGMSCPPTTTRHAFLIAKPLHRIEDDA